MAYTLVIITALLASLLTFFSGFGLGTMLMPVMAIYFPIPVAVAMTAIVHLANNLFKLFLVGRHANKSVLVRFGLPAVVTAFAGAWVLQAASALHPISTYDLGGQVKQITWIKLIIGLVIAAFSALELWPRFAKLSIDQKYLPIGGALSGFFGGLSGHQGALRSMFLIKSGLSKNEFIGTNVILAVMVDVTRLLVYGTAIGSLTWTPGNERLIGAATLAAFAGAWAGKRLLDKVTLRSVQVIVGIMLGLIGLGLAAGLI